MLERSTYNNSYVAGQHQWITTCTGDFGHFRITSENQHSAMTRFPGKLFSRLAWLEVQSGGIQMFLEMYHTSWTCNDICISKMHWKVDCLQGHQLNSSRASDPLKKALNISSYSEAGVVYVTWCLIITMVKTI